MTDSNELAGRAKDLVQRIAASPRFAGSDAERDARDFCGDQLRAAGFHTALETFEYSEFPARFGPSLCGVTLILGAFLSARLATVNHLTGAAVIVSVIGMITSTLLGKFFLKSVLSFPSLRRTSANLVATRGQNPHVWLVAHTDSKSQTLGMLLRIGSIVLGSILYVMLVLSLLRIHFGFLVPTDMPESVLIAAIITSTAMTTLALIPFTLCFITNRSPGALDNASGVVAVLLASELVVREKSFGVILTSGEELALAGAQAFVALDRLTGVAVNCDTIDNAGRFVCMTTGRPRAARTALAKGAGKSRQPVRVRGTIPGILTDSMAFAAAGWDTCTLSRGNLATLARVHTSGDTPGRIDGTGIALAARILAATIEELT